MRAGRGARQTRIHRSCGLAWAQMPVRHASQAAMLLPAALRITRAVSNTASAWHNSSSQADAPCVQQGLPGECGPLPQAPQAGGGPPHGAAAAALGQPSGAQEPPGSRHGSGKLIACSTAAVSALSGSSWHHLLCTTPPHPSVHLCPCCPSAAREGRLPCRAGPALHLRLFHRASRGGGGGGGSWERRRGPWQKHTSKGTQAKAKPHRSGQFVCRATLRSRLDLTLACPPPCRYGDDMNERKWLARFIYLESVAGVPGMVGGESAGLPGAQRLAQG